MTRKTPRKHSTPRPAAHGRGHALRKPPRKRPGMGKKPTAAAKTSTDESTGNDAEQHGDLERLQKILAAAGLGSRRYCEELIETGRVEVDGKVVTELGSKADPHTQRIRVDGTPLPTPDRVYFLLHKPTGVVSTNSDPSGRPRVIDLVPYRGRLFTVGRLDLSSEGLILVTNDGELANRLTHPRYGVEKTYHAEVAGEIDRGDLEKLRGGIHLAEGLARVERVRVKQQYKNSTLLEIVLAEGRNREVRRILARIGHKVLRLKRVALGPLRLAELPSGAVRPLTREEVRALRASARHQPRPRYIRSGSAPKPKPKRPASPTRSIIGGDAPPRSKPGKARGPRAAGGPRTK